MWYTGSYKVISPPQIKLSTQVKCRMNVCVCVCVCVTDSLSCTPENNTQIVTLSESESESRSIMTDSLRPHGLYSPWNSPGQNTGVGILSLLQGIFSTQGSNPGLLHCRKIFNQLSHKGRPDH